jgi:hypothetical protein
MDKGLIYYNIGAEVVIKNKKKDPSTGRFVYQDEIKFIYFRPELPSLGSMNLFEIPQGNLLINLGLFYDEFISNNKQLNFAIITQQNITEV